MLQDYLVYYLHTAESISLFLWCSSSKKNIFKEFLPSIASEQVSLTFIPLNTCNFDNAFEPGAREKKEESLPHLQTTSERQQRLYSRRELHQQLLQRILKPICTLLNISKYPHWKEKNPVCTDIIQFSTHLRDAKRHIINYELW